MSWIKNIFVIITLSITTIIMVDLLGYPFREKAKKILPNYGSPIEEFSRGYPLGHFQPDELLGFDITPNFHTVTQPNLENISLMMSGVIPLDVLMMNYLII